MDLYKWAYKFYPWVSSEIIIDAFELARDARILDMQASPYDLRAWDVDPVMIETVEGRKQYESRQRELASRAVPIRRHLLQELTRLELDRVYPVASN